MKKILQKLLICLLSVTAGAALFAACGQTPCEKHTPSKNRIITEETHSAVCADCGETISTQPHAFGAWHTRTEKTCTEDGLEYAICSGCAYEKTRPIAATGHTEPTWLQTEEGHTQVCDECETTLGEFGEHTFGEWTVKQEAGCGVAGAEMRACSVCAFEETKEIEALKHMPKDTLSFDEDGHWQVCSTCEEMMDGTFAVHVFENGSCDCGYHLPTPADLVDFVVEVPVGRNPIVLQLTDTQIIDAAQTRPGRPGVLMDYWATDQVEERCYDYITETVQKTKPDLILMTGDIVYGEFDDTGTALLGLINLMESFQIPWAPVFGNHDNESKKGVDWQCEQFENAQYCLFEQRELTGNGNYSVGLVQGGELIRAFYMLDSNGCGNASAESLANGHTKSNAGFAQDQIDWYTQAITRLHKFNPDTKISFAYHIQQMIFAEAYAKYGFDQSVEELNINIDRLENKEDTDFGYIGRPLKGPWDSGKTVWRGMKKLGVDSIFVGHEHCNSSSVIYEGVRLQFGQKSSTYDRANYVNMTSGAIVGGAGPIGTPLIGGTVMVLTEGDGTIEDAYIYLCENAGGNIDWDQWKTYEVNGLQLGSKDVGEMWDDGVVGAISTKFDDTVNAHKVTATSQGKLYINPSLLRGKKTLSFTIYIPSTSTANLAGMGAFAIRLKPDDSVTATVPNVTNASGKYYIIYKTTNNDPVKLEYDCWKTYTVDISNIAETCTEFSFLVASGNVIWLRDVAVS